ncbi:MULTISPECIES: carboxymuconolactone decarboxylase family protein [unclassified Streptomyces]|uniref:carboxymuconolactone decarboxylase family protein n=1 Tax=unclassified Streptomyces TaxID=2593676 RepID=UPI002E328B4C|nr:carboxymuconolactone decarboxylase family protein [Streptomyces sp. NBC_01460]WSS28572.1 carboxymuconolactone decarboxylase family protein [Streptomyces sp. NBC_01185]
MTTRMNHPAFVVPGAIDALVALGKASKEAGVPVRLLELLHLRASQINGDSANVDRHPRLARAAGEDSEERLLAVASWRNTPYFTEAERAALALTEAVTLIGNEKDPVPDEVWAEATKHFKDQELGAILLSVGTVNLWNRLHVAIRQQADPTS